MAELKELCDALRRYHNLSFTPGVYEHSIVGLAAMKLEEQQKRIADLEEMLVYVSSSENKVYRNLSFEIEFHSLINPKDAMQILCNNIARVFRRLEDGKA